LAKPLEYVKICPKTWDMEQQEMFEEEVIR